MGYGFYVLQYCMRLAHKRGNKWRHHDEKFDCLIWDVLNNQVLQSQQFLRHFVGTFDAIAHGISASCVYSAFVCM